MDPGERPFPCKIDGCRLSFTTEDHLIVHRQKHDTLLNLELPNKSNLFADQTPTPTRLIGKCEEVGLFEDLQNVNPFEETFRRAVEEKNAGSAENSSEKNITVLGPGAGNGDETLHTPHVFPLLERRDSHKLSKLIISRSNSKKDDVPINKTLHTGPVAEIRQSSVSKQKVFKNVSNKKPAVNILPKSTQPVILINRERDEGLSVFETSTPLHPVKAKLKKYLARNGPLVADEVPPSTTCTINTNKREISVVPDGKQVRSTPESVDQKHERWKAAAKRYRTRVKQNQNTLHRKNLELKEENLRLKTELAQMKSALSLHVDCSVTRALAAFATATSAGVTAGPSQVMCVPVVGQNQQQMRVVPMEEAASSQHDTVAATAPAVSNKTNPVYIILGGINTVINSEKPIKN
ncbi:uncharacterized protein LOC134217483 [Armigeres subalbatus]|uniref:uncharacterized protein LOC134217483 n=1 Tax=Armigeres subalbatus TaxID=124917 RepID=UPI002ED306E1